MKKINNYITSHIKAIITTKKKEHYLDRSEV